MRDESAGQCAHRHEAPAEHAVDAVDPAEQVRGHDLLAQADRDDVPHGHGEPCPPVCVPSRGRRVPLLIVCVMRPGWAWTERERLRFSQMLNPRTCEQSWSTLLVLELDVADLAATGFAISPLSETVRAVQLLAKRETPAVNAPWVRWARNELGWRPLRLPRLWPLIVNGVPTHPEFQAPALEVRMPELGVELARLCATPAAAVRASLHRVWEGHPWPESARELAARPRESLAEIAAEIGECYDRLIAPHWEPIRPAVEADIAYRASLLADGGARSLFSDLHPDLHWSGGTLTLMLGPNGVVLMPRIFNWPLGRRAPEQSNRVFCPRAGSHGAVRFLQGIRLGHHCRRSVSRLCAGRSTKNVFCEER